VPDKHITVLVADDSALVRYALMALAREVLGDVTFAEAHDAESVVRAARLHPGLRLALVDIMLQGTQEGWHLLELTRRHPQLPIIVVSSLPAAEVMRRVMTIRSVRAYMSRLRQAIQTVALELEIPLAQTATGGASQAATLTPRQEQIRGLLRQGLSNKVIASALGISEGTVKNHITEILRTLKATNRTQAARMNLQEDQAQT
jgi:DNA-binding NarL/FixJ family response regulator